LTDEEFAEKLLFEEKVAVVPGSAFGAAGAGYVRSAYCTAYDQLEEALVRIERFVRQYA
jgi:aminotransferase